MIIIIQPGYEFISNSDDVLATKILQLLDSYKQTKQSKLYLAEWLSDKINEDNYNEPHQYILGVRFTCSYHTAMELSKLHQPNLSVSPTQCNILNIDYCSPELQVVLPCNWKLSSSSYKYWLNLMSCIETTYNSFITNGVSIQKARALLPLCLKTTVEVTTTLRHWKSILAIRCSKNTDQDVRQLMLPLLTELHNTIPVLFDGLYEKHLIDILEYQEEYY